MYGTPRTYKLRITCPLQSDQGKTKHTHITPAQFNHTHPVPSSGTFSTVAFRDDHPLSEVQNSSHGCSFQGESKRRHTRSTDRRGVFLMPNSRVLRSHKCCPIAKGNEGPASCGTVHSAAEKNCPAGLSVLELGPTVQHALHCGR